MTDEKTAEAVAALEREDAEYERRMAIAADPDHPDPETAERLKRRREEIAKERARLTGAPAKSAERRPRGKGAETRA